MAGLLGATHFQPSGTGFVVALDAAWDIWGPAGGYIAAIALRAVRERAPPGHRPVTLTGQFVRVAKPGELRVTVEPVKQGGTSLFLVTLSQADEPVFLAQIWTTARNDPSINVQPAMPDVPMPLALRSADELVAERGGKQIAFWQNMDGRPVHFRMHTDPLAETPRQMRWLRLKDWTPTDDPFFEAMRCALLVDIGVWPGHGFRLTEQVRYMAPSLDITVWFHGGAPGSDWLLSDADTDMSANGLISGRMRVWSDDGRALATGGGHGLVTLPRAPK